MAWSAAFFWRPRRFALTRPNPPTRHSGKGRYRPHLEALEDRWVPTTVSNLADSGSGSLREALILTPANGVINFAPGLGGTLALTSGALQINKNVTITGPGTSVLTISGSNLSQVFTVSPFVTATFADFTVTNGRVVGANASGPGSTGGNGNGGAIANFGNLTLYRLVVASSTAVGGVGGNFNGINAGTGGAGNGGAIYSSGTLVVNESTFASDAAIGGVGGDGGPTGTGGVGGTGAGGALYSSGVMILTNITLSGNTATGGYGGAGSSQGTGGNGQGGGISLAGGSLGAEQVTIASNAAFGAPGGSGGNGQGDGGGIFIVASATANLQNTLVATNVATTGPDVLGRINSADHVLLGDGTGSTGAANGVNGNIVGTSSNPIDPRIGILQNNFGPTPTRALLTGSPAIDAGTNAIYPPIDQRGLHRRVNGFNDIGAYEYQPPATITFLQVSPNPVTFGQPVTLTASVIGAAPGSNPAPGGTVTFSDGSTILGTAPLVNNVATLVVPALAPGNRALTAHYNGFAIGDYAFAPSTSGVVTEYSSAAFFAVGGAPGRVQVIRSLDAFVLADFAPYGPFYTGPVSVAVGDVSGDGLPDLVTGALVGNPDVRVFDGRAFLTGTFNPANPNASLLAQWFPYALQFNVGATVAVGDIEHDGFADIVTGASAGNPDVRVYRGRDIATGTFDPNGASLVAQWFPYALQFNVGANVAVGDVSRNGYADVVTGATVGNPDVRVYSGLDIASHNFHPDGSSLLAAFFPYALNFNVGAFVAVGDVNGDGYADVITGASSGNPDVRVYNGFAISQGTFNNNNPDASLPTQFYAYDLNNDIGAAVAAADFEHNGHWDILTGPTQGLSEYRVVNGLSTGIRPPALIDNIAADIGGGLYVGA